MEISIKVDDRSLKDFTNAMREQVPFATAVALTRTAAQAKDRVKQELPHRMVIRNQHTAGSIRSVRAEKHDWPNPKSIVGSLAPYLEIQEEGGTKSPSSKAFSIPKGIRTSENRLVPRSKWPGKILPSEVALSGGGRARGAKSGSRSKAVPFLIREQNGIGIYIRIGKGRKLKRLYRLTRETLHVKARHWLATPVTEIVKANLANNFVQALAQALK